MKPYFVVEAYTNVGRIRENNEDNYYVNGRYLENAELEDYFIIDIPTQKGVFGVFDGMGGQSNGEFASYTAAQTLANYQHQLMKNPDEYINDYVQKANLRICTEIQRTKKKIGTTMGVAVINEDKLKIYNIGDTRVYYFRDGKIYQLSKDHTTVNQLVEAGIITREQASTDVRRSELSQHLGILPEEMIIQPHTSQEIDWGEDDVLLICSDGVTDVLTNQELEEIVNQCSKKGFFAEHIVKTAIRKGSQDNATAIVVQACGKNGIKGKKSGNTNKKKTGIIATTIVACLLVGTIGGVLLNKAFNKTPEIDDATSSTVSTSQVVESTTILPESTDVPEVPTIQTQPGNENVSVPASVWATPKNGIIKPQEVGYVNLRRMPGTMPEDISDTIQEPTEAKIYFEESLYDLNWYYVEVNGNHYWVSSQYVEII